MLVAVRMAQRGSMANNKHGHKSYISTMGQYIVTKLGRDRLGVCKPCEIGMATYHEDPNLTP